MKGFGIYVKNDLLEAKHFTAMGEAVWLYLWLLDKITSVDENGIGKVLGGKPIKHEDVSKDLPILRRTYYNWLKRLQDSGYVSWTKTPYGATIRVHKAFKRFNVNTVQPNAHPVQNNAHLSAKKVTSNKDNTVDNTVDKEQAEFKTFFKQPNSKKPKGHILAQAREICQIFSDHKGGAYNSTLHLTAAVDLLQLHGYDRVKEVALFAVALTPRQFQVKIDSPVKLADKWPAVIELMENPPKQESKYGIKY